jgi:hypothetical protein
MYMYTYAHTHTYIHICIYIYIYIYIYRERERERERGREGRVHYASLGKFILLYTSRDSPALARFKVLTLELYTLMIIF